MSVLRVLLKKQCGHVPRWNKDEYTRRPWHLDASRTGTTCRVGCSSACGMSVASKSTNCAD